MLPEGRPLSIGLLGSPEVTFKGRPLRFATRKSLALLCYLAAEGEVHPRGELSELLWPGKDERRARTDLRSALAKLKKTLGANGAGTHAQEGDGLLTVEGELLGVAPGKVGLDLIALESAVILARDEVSRPSSGRDPTPTRRDVLGHLEVSLGIYRGEFMEGFRLKDAGRFELWLETERARWLSLFAELCERTSRLQSEAGRLEEAIATARHWTRHAPLEEEAHLRLMELLSAAGQGEAALPVYEDFRGALRRELGIEPSASLNGLASRLRAEAVERASLGTSLALPATTHLLLDVPFVGRREQFGALVSEYHACVSGGEPRVVAMMGEAGMGKTRLAREFLGWAKSRGADVLEGAASEGAGFSYGPLVEAMRPRIERERAPDDLLEDAWLSELSRLLPELRERYPDLPSPVSVEGGTAKGALFEAIARAVGALAHRAPVVLALDDLQWADATTLEVLDYAGRRWAELGVPVMVLVAARPEEPEGSSTFEGWLESSGQRLPVRILHLGSLGDEDVERLLRLMLGVDSKPASVKEGRGGSNGWDPGLERFGEWLAAESAGQPFYMVEMLKSLLEEGKLVLRVAPEGGNVLGVSPTMRLESGLLPQSVRGVIHSRLSRLSLPAAELLAAGAVLRRGFGFESLVGVAGLGEPEGLRGLDELLGRGILLEEGGQGEGTARYEVAYSFSHEKIRQVAYTEGGRARRQVLHRRAFRILEEGGAPPAELARHALAAGLARPSFEYSVAAGDAASEVFAVRDAIVHYERAHDLLAEVRNSSAKSAEPSIPTLERLYAQMGHAYEMADEREEARETYEAMLTFARGSGEARLEVAALNLLAAFLFHQENEPARVTALLEEARRVAKESSLAEALAETECNLVDVTALQTREAERSRPIAEGALDTARALGPPGLLGRALTALARLEIHAGRLEEAATYAEEGASVSRELAENSAAARSGLPSILATVTGLAASWWAGNKAMEIQCLIYLAYARIYQGRPQEGMAIARNARYISAELPERVEARSLLAIGMGLQESGEYGEALALAKKGTERARRAQDAFLLGANLIRLGDTCEALQNVEEARAAYEEAKAGHYGIFSHAKLCVLDALCEDWEAAHALARKAYKANTFLNPLLSVHLHQGVEALLRGGDEGPAREQVRRFADRAKTNGRDRMSYLRALAVLSAWEDDAEKAISHLHEAEALAEDIGLPGELWQVRSRIGEIEEQRGEDGEAREAFSRAEQTLKELAGKMDDKEIKEGFLSAPRVRRALEHDS